MISTGVLQAFIKQAYFINKYKEGEGQYSPKFVFGLLDIP